MSTHEPTELLKSLVACDRGMVKLLATGLGNGRLRDGLQRVHRDVQQLESEIDVLSFEDAAYKEHEAFRAVEEIRHGKVFSDQVAVYVRKRNQLLGTGDESVLAFLAVLAENQRRLLDASDRFSKFESEIDVLSFAGAIVKNHERLLEGLEGLRSLLRRAA